jgi:hypothetical protein
MDATAPPSDAPLPTDVTTLQAMVRELLARVQQLEAQNAVSQAKLDAALKHRFGRRSSAARRRDPPPRSPHPGVFRTGAPRCPNTWNGATSFTT